MKSLKQFVEAKYNLANYPKGTIEYPKALPIKDMFDCDPGMAEIELGNACSICGKTFKKHDIIKKALGEYNVHQHCWPMKEEEEKGIYKGKKTKGYGWKGTGTIRQNKWDKEFKDIPTCEHKCPHCYNVWHHKSVGKSCYLPSFASCLECVEFPGSFPKNGSPKIP